MDDTERKALALSIEVREDARMRLCPDPTLIFGNWEALCRAIEQHEAFRQEVSDAVEAYFGVDNYLGKFNDTLSRFIIAKPDPLLIEAREMWASKCEHESATRQWRDGTNDYTPGMEVVLAALKRGMELEREKSNADPLVEALEEASGTNDPVEWANRFYAAIEKRGGKITWEEG